ncbi:conjugative transposon protein TraK [Mucilaginibacter daejeonensis]|uniref:conjugative transposon protein TraK n=1 Tax=Mucilaginibacter daejeonensis TaxID=398049 RepID=UPI001D171A9F|nr:conjugative transposon protein TraK [Mucilaginibacter daejeonensis]UEG54889.1 conjugative transposon protein TraK [Mucilaginibacter daejeonensis]
MFSHLRNIETAFQQNKRIVALVIITSALIAIAAMYLAFRAYQKADAKVYVLANGKALEAMSADRRENIPVEARDHIKMFHHYFFTLDPDEKVIEGNIRKALYLADESASNQYNGLKEKSYYNNLISGNISQEIQVDSIQLNMNSYPYFFKCYAKEKLVRATSTIHKVLITKGYLRNVGRSDNNPHGFLIEKWETIINRDTTTSTP